MKTLLAPVDFSAVTTRVVDEASALARALNGRIVLFHVTEPIASVVDFAVVAFSTARVDEAAVKQAVARLQELQAQLNAQGLDAESVHTVGSPVHEIVEQAKRLAADYIVIGSHGHKAFYDLLVGSTTSGILKHARCPIVVVPAATGRLKSEEQRRQETAKH